MSRLFTAGARVSISIPAVEDDAQAYERIPEMRWVYHKPLLYDRLGVDYGLYPALPNASAYPVVIKPVINLYGLARGVSVAHSPDDIANAPGCLWMPMAHGNHWSVDVSVSANGIAIRTVQGVPHPRLGMFSYWMRADAPTDVEAVVREIVAALDISEGVINVELIGTTPIEVHLRPSDEFDWLYSGEAVYARPLLEPFRTSCTDDDVASSLNGYRHKSCVTGDDLPEYAAPGWYRYAVVYGDDLAALKRARVF